MTIVQYKRTTVQTTVYSVQKKAFERRSTVKLYPNPSPWLHSSQRHNTYERDIRISQRSAQQSRRRTHLARNHPRSTGRLTNPTQSVRHTPYPLRLTKSGHRPISAHRSQSHERRIHQHTRSSARLGGGRTSPPRLVQCSNGFPPFQSNSRDRAHTRDTSRHSVFASHVLHVSLIRAYPSRTLPPDPHLSPKCCTSSNANSPPEASFPSRENPSAI